MVRLCKKSSDWLKLNSVLAVINKRDSLIKSVVVSVVSEVMSYIDSTPNVEVRIELIKALKDLCDGKIYVEGESAALHFKLSKIFEEQNDIDRACDIIQDVHVETYGSLSKKEKATYILEQMRLNLLKKDYIRMLIHSRKMNPKTIEEKGFTAIKFQYYSMMIDYYAVEKNAWEISSAYYKVFEFRVFFSFVFTFYMSFVTNMLDCNHRVSTLFCPAPKQNCCCGICGN
jgi:26S proteasome regulatory subunit N5